MPERKNVLGERDNLAMPHSFELTRLVSSCEYPVALCLECAAEYCHDEQTGGAGEF